AAPPPSTSPSADPKRRSAASGRGEGWLSRFGTSSAIEEAIKRLSESAAVMMDCIEQRCGVYRRPRLRGLQVVAAGRKPSGSAPICALIARSFSRDVSHPSIDSDFHFIVIGEPRMRSARTVRC
ncbi:unnamed protein product, partial [Vitrella brassicaformis CCMP3155]